jgi:hypothetical protein
VEWRYWRSRRSTGGSAGRSSGAGGRRCSSTALAGSGGRSDSTMTVRTSYVFWSDGSGVKRDTERLATREDGLLRIKHGWKYMRTKPCIATCYSVHELVADAYESLE